MKEKKKQLCNIYVMWYQDMIQFSNVMTHFFDLIDIFAFEFLRTF